MTRLNYYTAFHVFPFRKNCWPGLKKVIDSRRMTCLRTFARQGVLQPGVSRFAMTSGHPLYGGARLVLTDVASARVAHDASVDSNGRLSGSSVERWPPNRCDGSWTRGWGIGLRNRESARNKHEISPHESELDHLARVDNVQCFQQPNKLGAVAVLQFALLCFSID